MKIISKIFLLTILSSFLIIACGENQPEPTERVKATVEKVEGTTKETVGKITGNNELKNEGQVERTKGDLRSTKEDVKDLVLGDDED